MRHAAATLLIAATALAAEAPQIVLNHTGRLLDGADQPVEGNATLTFRLYELAARIPDVPEEALWEESFTVTLHRGVYAADLGSTDGNKKPIPFTAFPAGATRYLAVAIDGAELSPRLRVGRTPLAVRAEKALEAEVALDAEKLGGESPAAYHDAARLTGVAPPAVLGSGSTGLTTLGTVTTGAWQATPIDDAYVAGASRWDGKLAEVAHDGSLAGKGTAGDTLRVAFGASAGTAAAGNDARFSSLAGSSFTTLLTAQHGDNQNFEEFTFGNATAYRYYRVYVTTGWCCGGAWISIAELELFEVLQ
jgi:hypothetical protein